MSTELDALLALGQSRRAAGLPCNPMRAGRDDVDWLSEAELQTAQTLTLRIALEARLAAVCWEPA